MKRLFLIILFLCASYVYGNDDDFYQNNFNHCKPTKPAMNDYEPEKFQPTNNLLRSTGQYPIYCGEKIIIKGRVVDPDCVPVVDAKVYLWQVGCDGKYPYKPLRTKIDKHLLNLKNGSSFQGAGVATTNNNGEFYFVTIFPPKVAGMKSHLNFRVEHSMLGSLQTKFYLAKNSEKENFGEDNYILGNLIEDTDIYNVEIVMPRYNTLKSY